MDTVWGTCMDVMGVDGWEVTRDVVSPKVGYDPLSEPGRIIYQPGSAETHEEEKEEE